MEWLLVVAMALLLGISWNASQGKRYAKEARDHLAKRYEGYPCKVIECPYCHRACEAFPLEAKPCDADLDVTNEPAHEDTRR